MNSTSNSLYQTRVEEDVKEGQRLGLRGVPFFVVDRKYAIAGAQQPEGFLRTLEKAFDEWKKGKSCTFKS